MARSIWSGSISFGLVNVPVKAFTAVHDHKVHFHRLEASTGARVRNQQVSDKTGEALEPDDVELGYEIGKGRYVTFDQAEIDELKPASTRSIDVTDFVPLEDIDPVFYEHTYWLAPDGDAAAKPYGLLLAAMADQQRVGIGTVVMRTKQYLAAVRPFEGALAMSTMRFADEVVPRSDIDQLPKKLEKPSKKELGLARQIVDALATDWEPERYHDTFTEELRDLIEHKDDGDDVVEEPDDGEGDAKVLDLMEALQASIDQSRSGRRSASGASKKKGAPAKKATKKTAGPTSGTSAKKKAPARKKAPAKKATTKKAPDTKTAATKKRASSPSKKAAASGRSHARSA
jgi:DNA end-binding protein Ku